MLGVVGGPRASKLVLLVSYMPLAAQKRGLFSLAAYRSHTDHLQAKDSPFLRQLLR